MTLVDNSRGISLANCFVGELIKKKLWFMKHAIDNLFFGLFYWPVYSFNNKDSNSSTNKYWCSNYTTRKKSSGFNKLEALVQLPKPDKGLWQLKSFCSDNFICLVTTVSLHESYSLVVWTIDFTADFISNSNYVWGDDYGVKLKVKKKTIFIYSCIKLIVFICMIPTKNYMLK